MNADEKVEREVGRLVDEVERGLKVAETYRKDTEKVVGDLRHVFGHMEQANGDHMCCLWRASGSCVQRGGVQHAY